MKLYLGTPTSMINLSPELAKQSKYTLEAFPYTKEVTIKYLKYWDFMLDSGAFTFIGSKKKLTGRNL